MGQIKNIKLHIVTDIKVTSKTLQHDAFDEYIPQMYSIDHSIQ